MANDACTERTSGRADGRCRRGQADERTSGRGGKAADGRAERVRRVERTGGRAEEARTDGQAVKQTGGLGRTGVLAVHRSGGLGGQADWGRRAYW